MAVSGTDVQYAKELLCSNELVVIPTETVYGLAGNALNPEAVATIYEVKNRPSFNPLIIHTDRLEKVTNYVSSVPRVAQQLANAFWPGPLTILLPKTDALPDIVTAGSDRVAVRIPQHPLTLSLLKELDFPLAAPSANPFGYISPTTVTHVEAQLGDKINYILDGGSCSVGIESTIVGVKNDGIEVYRWGGISLENIKAVVPNVQTYVSQTEEAPSAPGMLKSHYAPSKKVIIGNLTELLGQYPPSEVGIISFQNIFPQVPENQQCVLSASGNLNEAARELFSSLRQLDSLAIKVILAELVPNYGLGRAINDRLARASA
ncbi:L-threonylcarbamoyladenylate synthase [Tunicatimonas pelagia]|uniref:L-threonylcarbamoyladenylate synthase n=1 Tax=Tunicatimonas pelagia TaxID=931531 RepID=UPI002665FEB5|nr:L-threonylcarbamoyladenylate synthase [Tunicatimonas pelagia]WKN45044.1 L-threonylcarbamoyladenylate synthase [Tunicatimonas pelagia]